MGRVDDMLIIRGINVYPREVETALLEDEAIGGQYGIIVDRRTTLPELRVVAELADPGLVARREEIRDRVARALTERVRIRVQVDLRDPGTLPRQEVGKARRVFEQTTDESPFG